jgi:hypothetical protein
MSDLPAFANLGQEILESDVSRYFLVARTEDRKDILVVPLALDGSEPLEHAVSRFKDAMIVSKQCFSQKGEYHPLGSRVDGRPRTEQEIATAAFYLKARQMGWTADVQNTDEFKRLDKILGELGHDAVGSLP